MHIGLLQVTHENIRPRNAATVYGSSASGADRNIQIHRYKNKSSHCISVVITMLTCVRDIRPGEMARSEMDRKIRTIVK